MGSEYIAKLLVYAGAVLIGIGGVIWLTARVLPFGKLPGDFHFSMGKATIFFPFATSILLSLFLSLIMYLIRYFSHD